MNCCRCPCSMTRPPGPVTAVVIGGPGGRPDAEYRTRQKFSDAGMLIDAAGLGLGVALARVSLVADRLASGALVCPLRLAAPTPFSYYLLCLPEAVDRPKIALFRSILISEAAL